MALKIINFNTWSVNEDIIHVALTEVDADVWEARGDNSTASGSDPEMAVAALRGALAFKYQLNWNTN